MVVAEPHAGYGEVQADHYNDHPLQCACRALVVFVVGFNCGSCRVLYLSGILCFLDTSGVVLWNRVLFSRSLQLGTSLFGYAGANLHDMPF